MHDENIRYPSFSFLQDVLSFLVKIFLSFPKLVKIVFHYSLHSKLNHEFTPIYPSLRTKSISSSCTFDFDQDPSFEPHDIKDHPCEPDETTVDNISVAHSPFLPIFQTDTDHFTYLLFFMISLQSTTNTFLILMENPRTLQLKNIYKPLSIFLTSLK